MLGPVGNIAKHCKGNKFFDTYVRAVFYIVTEIVNELDMSDEDGVTER